MTKSRGGGAARDRLSLLCLLEMIRRGFLLVGARPRQDAVEADVVLVTRVSVPSAAFMPIKRRRPLTSPGGGIVDGEPVIDLVVGHASPRSTRSMFLEDASKRGSVVEIGGFDHQRIALPIAARIATDVVRQAAQLDIRRAPWCHGSRWPSCKPSTASEPCWAKNRALYSMS